MQPTKCVVCYPQGLDHSISFLPSFLILDLGFRIFDILMGFRSFVELFVIEVFHEDLGTIYNFFMLVNSHVPFVMLSLFYVQHLVYLIRIMFPSRGIL